MKRKGKTRFGHLRILIAEDQHDVRSVLRGMLEEMGISQLFEAANGREALEMIKAGNVDLDLVICDWNMPEMNGVDLLKQLKEVRSSLPLMMVTGRGDQDSVMEAINSGVAAYIRKPYSAAQLKEKLQIVAQKSGL